MSTLTFFNCFEVPAGREDELLARWQRIEDYMEAKPGYVAHRMHRSLAPDAAFRFINLVEWTDLDEWNAARDAGFAELLASPGGEDFRMAPTLCEVIDSGGAFA
jgi:heme-degrading monooxygenase HmoA